MGKQLRERFCPAGAVLLQGRIVAAPSQFLIENVWRLLFCGREFKKIITRVINATLAVRLLMFLFYVCFCSHHPLASSVYVHSHSPIECPLGLQFLFAKRLGPQCFLVIKVSDIEILQCILHCQG
jgi:hypothetical protein